MRDLRKKVGGPGRGVLGSRRGARGAAAGHSFLLTLLLTITVMDHSILQHRPSLASRFADGIAAIWMPRLPLLTDEGLLDQVTLFAGSTRRYAQARPGRHRGDSPCSLGCQGASVRRHRSAQGGSPIRRSIRPNLPALNRIEGNRRGDDQGGDPLLRQVGVANEHRPRHSRGGVAVQAAVEGGGLVPLVQVALGDSADLPTVATKTIRRYVFCSFLALVLRQELEARLAAAVTSSSGST